MAVACMVPLDTAAQRRVETSTDVVWWVINRRFNMWIPLFAEELYSEGSVALCIAARNFDPSKARWSTYSVAAVWGGLTNYLKCKLHRWYKEAAHTLDYYGRTPDCDFAYNQTPAHPDRDRARPLYDVENFRPLPQRQEWSCVECHKPIDWDKNRRRRLSGHAGHGLCASCASARGRAKKRWGGRGVCARCARVIRSKPGAVLSWTKLPDGRRKRVVGPSSPKCACAPDYCPSLTLASAKMKPAWVLGSERTCDA